MTKCRKYSKLVSYSFLLGLSIISLNTNVYSEKIKISKDNIKKIRIIDKNSRFACYTKSSTSQVFFAFQKSNLQVGDNFSLITKSVIQKKIDDIKRKIPKIRKNSSLLKSTKKDLALLNRQLSVFDKNFAKCSLGQATPTPIPTKPSSTPTNPDVTPTPAVPTNSPDLSLNAYTDTLTSEEVRYLLNKVAFGGTKKLFDIGMNQGLGALVDALVDNKGLTEDGEKNLEDKANYWADASKYKNDSNKLVWTVEAAKNGQTFRFLNTENPFKEWMFLFLSSHFSTNLSEVGFAYNEQKGQGIANHWDILKQYSLGNFKDLLKAMIFDSAMNAWLNNEDNQKGKPNQNFAREFLELFTVGTIDPINGKPNYDEESVVAATGFLSGFIGDNDPVRTINYFSFLHDFAERRIFKSIPGAEITANFNYDSFVNYVLAKHPGAPRFLGERLFSQIIRPDASEQIVSTLSKLILDNDYNLKPILKVLLKSKAMFEPLSKQSCVTSPLEYLVKLARKVGLPDLALTGEWASDGKVYYDYFNQILEDNGQSLFEPPTVFGWKGSCGLNRSGQKAYGDGWLTAQYLVAREQSCTSYMNRLFAQKYDFRKLFPNPTPTVSELIDHIANNVLEIPITPLEKDAFMFFFLHQKSNGTYISINPQLNVDWYLQKKVPRLICLLTNLPRNNLK